MSMLSPLRILALSALLLLVLSGCRSRLGGDCDSNDGCALGLYCNMEKKVCEDRGRLLKKQAEEIYVYPIPGKKAVVPAPVPIPLPGVQPSPPPQAVPGTP